MASPVLLVIGAGPGISGSLARLYAADGYDVGPVGADADVLADLAADLPWHRAASLGVQKAGLRNLVRSLDTTLAPDGIRATTVTVRGSLSEEGPFSPSRVAAAIRDAARQDADAWQVEVPYDG